MSFGGAEWPDVIAPDVQTDDPVGALSGRAWGLPADVAAGSVDRETMQAWKPDTETPLSDLDRGAARAMLVVAHGTVDRFFPYYDVVPGDHDAALLAGLDEVDALAEGDREGVLRALGRFEHEDSDGHGFFGDWAGTEYVDSYLAVQVERVDGQPVIRASGYDDLLAGDTVVDIDGVDAAAWYDDAMTWHSAATPGYLFEVSGRSWWSQVPGAVPLVVRGLDGTERVRLVNRVALFVSGLLVPYLTAFFLAGRSGEATVQLVAMCALLGSVWLNANRRYAAARVVTLLTGDVLVAGMTIVLGRDSGLGLYATAAMVSPLIFYPRREWRTIGAFCTLTLVSSIAVDEWLVANGPLAPLPGWLERWCFAVSHAGSLVTVFAFVLYLYLESRQFEARLEVVNTQLETLAETDALTGVANRRRLERTLQVEWGRALRGGHPIAVVMIDVDHFKRYNDAFGHPSGDAALVRLAGAFAQGARRVYDVVGRYGGEEFLIVLPQSDSAGGAAAAERARLAVRALAIDHAPGVSSGCMTCSFGVASASPASGGDPHDLLERADAALYAAKTAGRDRVVVAPESKLIP